MRAVRDLARKRSQLVRTRTMHILAAENLVARQTGARISSNIVKQLNVEAIVTKNAVSRDGSGGAGEPDIGVGN
jgi:hypothetical protein